uniref:ShTK domain protein n=1 Tax=Haemonchus contortus TaxID=6289 RepID=A0A7I4Y2L7_HAECO
MLVACVVTFVLSPTVLGMSSGKNSSAYLAKDSTPCEDHGIFCRFVKSFCGNPEHAAIMKRDCSATCNLCRTPQQAPSDEASPNATEVRLPNGLRFRHRLAKTFHKNSTSSTSSNCTAGTADRKCVFPPEKRLTTVTQAPGDRKKENQTNTAGDTKGSGKPSGMAMVIKLPLNKTRNSLPKPFVQPPSSNKKLLEYMRNKTRSTASPHTPENRTEAVYNVSIVPVTESYEVRKVKLEELMNSTANLPQVTTSDIDSLSVSLSKTLIKGKCLDEYTYCREFSSLCMDPTFGDVMARHCTLTCKRCDDIEIKEEYGADCFDITPDCRSHLELCNHSKYRQLMKESCAKSCKLCQPACKDRHKNCRQFVEDGFCEDKTYTIEEQKHLCGFSCNFCQ